MVCQSSGSSRRGTVVSRLGRHYLSNHSVMIQMVMLSNVME
jgi:hypothetical protein